MSVSATYKPSPLSLGSPRSSPFRRPESPGSPRSSPFRRPESPSPQHRSTSPASSPNTSPTKSHQPVLISPSKLQNASTPPPSRTPSEPHWTSRGLSTTPTATSLQAPPSPTRSMPSSNLSAVPASSQQTSAFLSKRELPIPPSNSAFSFSQLPPGMLSQLRSAFSLLDRSSTGTITRSDVAATLADLGLPSGSADITAFFPPGGPQLIPLAQFLGSFAVPLGQISRQEELLDAFGAFDERDAGEVDVGVLRDALMHTGGDGAMSEKEVERALEGFSGRRAFGKGGGVGDRAEVFRYREFVGGLLGGGEEEKKTGK